jgi:hypothetical protein
MTKAFLAFISYPVILFSVIALTFLDLGLFWDEAEARFIASMPWTQFEVGDAGGNLFGRLTAVFAVFAAGKYYLNIFTQINLSGVKNKWADWSQVTLFISSLAFLPGLWPVWGNPKDWAVCFAIGVFLGHTVNNFSIHKLCMSALREGEAVFSSERRSSSRAMLSRFPYWITHTLLMSAALFLIWLFLKNGWAHDEKIYAVLFIIICAFQVYGFSIVHEGPQIKAGIARLIFLHRRIDRKRLASGEIVPTARLEKMHA